MAGQGPGVWDLFCGRTVRHVTRPLSGKGKVVPVLFFLELSTTPWRRLGSGGVAPRTLDFGIRWRWVVSFTPRPLYRQVKSPWYPLNRSLGGPQSRSRCGGEEKHSQSLPRLESLIIQRYTIELSGLLTYIRSFSAKSHLKAVVDLVQKCSVNSESVISLHSYIWWVSQCEYHMEIWHRPPFQG
jgi:hypothetical protein